MSQEKSNLHILLFGSIDSGKKTLAGHLLHKGGVENKSTIQRLEKEAKKSTGDVKHSWIYDKLQSEGTPSDLSFDTKSYHVHVTTATNERDFIQEMVREGPAIDVAILVLPADAGGFEGAWSETSATRQHTLLVAVLEIPQLLVVVNKIDKCDDPKGRFNQIVQSVSETISQTRHNPKSVAFVPISSLAGDNIFESSQKLSWYKGWSRSGLDDNSHDGSTLIDVLDTFKAAESKPLRFSVHDGFSVPNRGIVARGYVDYGTVKSGMKVAIAGIDNDSVEIVSIEKTQHETLDQAVAGDFVDLVLQNCNPGEVHSGTILGDVGSDAPRSTMRFTARVFVLNNTRMKSGNMVTVYCDNNSFPCNLKVIETLDPQSMESLTESPAILQKGDIVLVELSPTTKYLCVERMSQYPSLARFTIREGKSTVAVGSVQSVMKNAH